MPSRCADALVNCGWTVCRGDLAGAGRAGAGQQGYDGLAECLRGDLPPHAAFLGHHHAVVAVEPEHGIPRALGGVPHRAGDSGVGEQALGVEGRHEAVCGCRASSSDACRARRGRWICACSARVSVTGPDIAGWANSFMARSVSCGPIRGCVCLTGITTGAASVVRR